jgi:hypothetical protein
MHPNRKGNLEDGQLSVTNGPVDLAAYFDVIAPEAGVRLGVSVAFG